MATVKKREWTTRSGREREAWIVRYTDQHKKRHIETFAKKGDADRRKTVIESEVERRTHVARSQSITVAEAGRMWVEQAESDGLERGTIKQYEEHLRLHIEPLIGHIKLADLSPADVHDFRAQLGKTRSRAMVAKVVSSLSAILSEAVSKTRVARNVVREAMTATNRRHQRIEDRQERRMEAGIDFPTKPELNAIMNAAEGWPRALVVTVIFTGLRASELRGLRWQDLDLDHRVLRVRQRANFKNEIGATKSKAAKREIPLAPIAANALREWKLACPKGVLDLVFPTGNGTVRSHSHILYRYLAPLLARAGIAEGENGNPWYGLHSFRHAAAALFIEQGFPAKRVQELMGHASIHMTYNVYGHLFPTPEDDRKAMEEMQARLIS
jgi:integrase